ncbi:TPA: oligosaccharide flippase family protein [Vibrio vulnificus]|nr:oligosaccharide flippase family protein [Vibrio vulnificus]
MRKSFLSDISKLLSGTLVAQVLVFSITPILTRLYSPKEFGELSLFISIVSVLAVISSLRYNRAIIVSKFDKYAIPITWLGGVVTFVFFMILLIAISTLYLSNSDIIASQSIVFLILIPFSVLFAGKLELFNCLSIRFGDFANVAKAKVALTLTTLVTQLSFYYLGSAALIFGHFLGQLVGFIVNSYKYKNEVIKHKIDKKKSIALAKRYKEFPIYSTWEALANAVGNNIPVFIFATLFSSTAAGYFALTFKVLNIPMTLLGAAIGQVFFSRAAKAYHNGGLNVITEKLFYFLINIGMIPAIMITILSADIFSIVFSEQWLTSGYYAQVMTPWLFFVFISSPLSSLISISENQKNGLKFQVFLLSARVISLLIGAIFFSEVETLYFLTIVNIVSLTFFIYWLLKISGSNTTSVLMGFFRTSVFSFLVCTPFIIITQFYPENLMLILLAITVTTATYLIRMYSIYNTKVKSRYD